MLQCFPEPPLVAPVPGGFHLYRLAASRTPSSPRWVGMPGMPVLSKTWTRSISSKNNFACHCRSEVEIRIPSDFLHTYAKAAFWCLGTFLKWSLSCVWSLRPMNTCCSCWEAIGSILPPRSTDSTDSRVESLLSRLF